MPHPLDDYWPWNRALRVYPFAPPASDELQLAVSALGCAEEAHEILDAVATHAPREALLSELGDLLWYIVRLADQRTLPADELYTAFDRPAPKPDLAAAAANVAGSAKKLIRDGTAARAIVLKGHLLTLAEHLAGAIRIHGFTLDEVARYNRTKVDTRFGPRANKPA